MAAQTENRSKETNQNPEGPFEAWQAYYQRMTEEGMDFFQKSVEAAQNMTPFYPGKEAFQMWTDSYQDFMNRMGSTGPAAAADPSAYRKMYETWLQTWSENLETYMRTPEFASKSGKDLERFADFQKKMGEIMEAYWAAVHLPSSADMREVYHKLYLIDRKLDDLDERFYAIETFIKQAMDRKK